MAPGPRLPHALAVVGVALALSCSAGDGYGTNKAPREVVGVTLTSYEVRPDRNSVTSGPIRFTASNASQSDVHELAVLRVRKDSSLENAGEIEDLKPGASGEIVLDLPAGAYRLACLIAAGEEGSSLDHFAAGMVTDFEVR